MGRKASATEDDSGPRSFKSSDTRAALERKEKNPMQQINGEAARETGYAFEASGEQT
jgi:hypothetical protein